MSQDNKIIKVSQFVDHDSLDQRITDVVLFQTLGEVAAKRESPNSMRDTFIWNLIFDAAWERDMGVISTIAQRIDGGVPEADSIDSTASYFGSALTDVLNLTHAEQVMVRPEDPCIIALAKVIVWCSLVKPGNDPVLRKNKNAAIDFILNRIGGKKTQPVQKCIETTYVEPEWLRGLPEGEE